MLPYSTDCLKRNSKMKNKEQHTFPFIERLLDGVEVEWRVIGEVAEIYGGLTGKTKSDFEDGNALFVSYKNIYDNYEVKEEELDKVKVSEGEKQNKVEYGDILFTGSSETAEEVAFSSAVTTHFQEAVYLNSFSFGVRFHKDTVLIPQFSKHLFRGLSMRKQLVRTASGVTRFNVSKVRFKKLLIPIPPIHIQQRIVDILDKFTTLEAELEAELEGRKRQYEYYRNQLLSFELSKKGNKTQNNVTWLTIGEIFEMRNGYTPSKSNALFWNNGSIPWYRMEDIRNNGRFLEDSIQHITPQAIKGKGLFDAGSIIMATTATIGEHALLLTDALANQQFTNFKVRKSIKDKLTTKFIYYYFFIIDEWCKQNVNVSSFPSVSIDRLKLQPFPIPPLSEQQRIVSILDKFDTLTTSISEGLPKEIELRRKQYEFYRDRLLSFA